MLPLSVREEPAQDLNDTVAFSLNGSSDDDEPSLEDLIGPISARKSYASSRGSLSASPMHKPRISRSFDSPKNLVNEMELNIVGQSPEFDVVEKEASPARSHMEENSEANLLFKMDSGEIETHFSVEELEGSRYVERRVSEIEERVSLANSPEKKMSEKEALPCSISTELLSTDISLGFKNLTLESPDKEQGRSGSSEGPETQEDEHIDIKTSLETEVLRNEETLSNPCKDTQGRIQPYTSFTSSRRSNTDLPRYLQPTQSFACRATMSPPRSSFYKSLRHGVEPRRKAQTARKASRSQENEIGLLASQRLFADSRSRSHRAEAGVLSQREKEELFMRSIKPFKATPIDPRIFAEGGNVGFSRVERKPKKTKFLEFNLRTDVRAEKRKKPEILVHKPRGRRVEQPFAKTLELHKRALERRKRQLEKENSIAARQREFKAKPIRRHFPERRIVADQVNWKPTLTQPSTPETLVRSKRDEMKKMKAREMELQHIKSQCRFKAHPVPKTLYEAEKVQRPKIKREPIVALSPQLESQKRAESRKKFPNLVRTMKTEYIEQLDYCVDDENVYQVRKSIVEERLDMS